MSLKALLINCTLKGSMNTSNTEVLMAKAEKLLRQENVETEVVRFVDYNIKFGVSSDEGDGDEWPELLEKVKGCNIFIVGSPVWLGHLSSAAQQLLERLDAIFHEEEMWDKETGQYFTYNKVAGAICTGNEDGAHAVTSHLLWAMQELGFTVPPNVNAYWVGEAGPGPSFIAAGGERKLYPNKTTRVMVANLVYFARLLQQHPIPTNLNMHTKKAKEESDDA